MPEVNLTSAPAHLRHGSNIGQPLTRRDGVLKVKGQATYAADNHPPGMLFAVMAVSSIARGRVVSLDVTAAKRHPGVVGAALRAAPALPGLRPAPSPRTRRPVPAHRAGARRAARPPR